MGSLGVYAHFCDTRESPVSMEVVVFGDVVISHSPAQETPDDKILRCFFVYLFFGGGLSFFESWAPEIRVVLLVRLSTFDLIAVPGSRHLCRPLDPPSLWLLLGNSLPGPSKFP